MNLDSNDQLGEAKSKLQEDVFDDLGASDIPDEEKGVLLSRMLDLIQSRALVQIVEKLDEAKQKELEELTLKEDPDLIEKFLVENVPHYAQIFEDEAKKLRQELTIEFAE